MTSTPTATATFTPTFTPSNTPTITPTNTPAPCGNYLVSQTTGASIVAGTTNIGNACDDCMTTVPLPFAYQFYDQSFTSVNVSSNGNLQFTSANADYANVCLPQAAFNNTIFAYWDDLLTTAVGEGIFTSVSGVAPNRVFNIEWRAHQITGTGAINFEVRLYEGSVSRFDIVYGAVPEGGSSATVGSQRGTGSFVSQIECNTPNTISSGLQLSFVRPTCTACIGDYLVTTATGGSIVAGTADTSNHCDDCSTSIPLPFTYTLYDQSFTGASVTSNGQLDFQTADTAYTNSCFPDAAASYAIFPHWDDMRTDAQPNCPAGGCGVFTSVSGTAPFRVFNIEWRAVYFNDGTAVNFEVRLYEGYNYFEVVYGTGAQAGSSATIGSQMSTGSRFTQYECNTGGVPAGTVLRFNLVCQAATPTPTNTVTATGTATITSSPTSPATLTPTSTFTPSPTATAVDVVIGHVTWQGPLAQPSVRQQLPVTLTLALTGYPDLEYTGLTTDASGFFTVTLVGQPSGLYNWRVKGPKYLSGCGTMSVTYNGTTQQEMGLMKAGDIDATHNNIVNAGDFNVMKGVFGQASVLGDLNNDGQTNAQDFNLLKGNFGQSGCAPILSGAGKSPGVTP